MLTGLRNTPLDPESRFLIRTLEDAPTSLSGGLYN